MTTTFRPPLINDALVAEPGSFRDPAGGIVMRNGRVFRYLRGAAADELDRLLDAPWLRELVSSGALIESKRLDPDQARDLYALAEDVRLVVEHPRIEFLSYAYEWPFEMLKAAALRQLEVTRAALTHGSIVKDATPFNLQFLGPQPTFIDFASFERHAKGSGWRAYSQFCSLFLNPLLLQARTGVPFQPWLRSSLEGIDTDQLRSLLPWRSKLGKTVFFDVVLQSVLNHRLASSEQAARTVSKGKVPASAVTSLLDRLTRAVSGLKRPRAHSAWSEYEGTKSHYSAAAEAFKEAFVREQLAIARPHTLWDLGANRGQYSLIAAEYADQVVAMDSDEISVGALYERVVGSHRNVLPLVVDLLNPSPDQGWAQSERRGLAGRGKADWALCLALVHHLSISGNVPLPRIVEWLASITDAGIIEFVPKSDPMVQRLLITREDVYPEYTQTQFETALSARFQIRERAELPESQRALYVFSRS